MVRLYLLGFTHDLKGVVFSQRRGGRNATFWIPVDETLLEAIDKLESARVEAKGAARGRKGKAKPKEGPRSARARAEAARERVVLPPVGRSQSTGRLPAAEIQQMLREGRSVKAVVDASKAPQAWVERLLEPVLTERAGVIRLAQRATMSRPRLGRSGLPVGDAVIRNLTERRATADTIEGLDDAWDARASHAGTWRVWVRFGHRGKRRTAEWEFRKSTREVKPRNRLAAQLGWWPPEAGAAPEPIEDLQAPAESEEKEEAVPRRRAAKRRGARKKAPRPRKSRPKARARPSAAKRAPASKRKASRNRAAKRGGRRRP